MIPKRFPQGAKQRRGKAQTIILERRRFDVVRLGPGEASDEEASFVAALKLAGRLLALHMNWKANRCRQTDAQSECTKTSENYPELRLFGRKLEGPLSR